jgi:hypothetical protein
MAYNMFRIAAILQGIAKRVEAAPPPARRPRPRAKRRRPMAQLAWSFAQRG